MECTAERPIMSDIRSSDNEPRLGYWSAQEQYPLRDLLDFAVEAEKGGFGTDDGE